MVMEKRYQSNDTLFSRYLNKDQGAVYESKSKRN